MVFISAFPNFSFQLFLQRRPRLASASARPSQIDRFQRCEPTFMFRVALMMPDRHPQFLSARAQFGFVSVAMTQQRGVTVRHPQFARHGGDGEKRGQGFETLPPVEISRGRKTQKLITRQPPIFSSQRHGNPQMLRGTIQRTSRLQSPQELQHTLPRLDEGMDFGDSIPLPQLMHGRPVDTHQARNFGIRFVQMLADEFDSPGRLNALPLRT